MLWLMGEGGARGWGGSSWSLLIFFNGTLLWIVGSPHRTSLRLREQMCEQPTELYWWRDAEFLLSCHLMCSGSTETAVLPYYRLQSSIHCYAFGSNRSGLSKHPDIGILGGFSNGRRLLFIVRKQVFRGCDAVWFTG